MVLGTVALGAGALLVLLEARARRRGHRAMERVAAHYGLRQGPKRWLLPGALAGSVRGFDLGIECFRGASSREARLGRERQSYGTLYTVITVQAHQRLPALLSLEPRPMLRLERWEEPHDRVLTGDEAFDEAVLARGERVGALACLSTPARKLLELVLPHLDLEVRRSTVSCAIRGLPGSADALIQVVDQLVGLAERLSFEPWALEQRLAENLRQEGHPLVRQRLLPLLLEACDRSISGWAEDFALRGADLELRLFAARELGQKHLSVPLHLARDRNVDAALRARSLRLLGERLSRRRLLPIVGEMLAGTPFPLRNVALELAERQPDPSLLERLLAIVGHGPRETQEVLARALIALSPTLSPEALRQAELKLWRGLSHQEPFVQQAAATALGCFGSVESVPRLNECAARGARAELRQVISRAIQSIQTRAVHAGSGQLSVLASPETGGLSLSEDVGGVSLPE